MEINHFILVLISLSCLFSFSASRPAASARFEISDVQFGAPSPAISFESWSLSFPERSVEKIDQALSILPGSIDATLQRICGDTDHPIECLTTIVPFLDQNDAIEPVSVLKVGIEVMDNRTKEALAQATKLLQDPSTPKNVASCLEKCIDSYNAILDSDQKALEAISLRDVHRLSQELSSNVENVHDCEEAFEEAHVKSPIKDMDSLLGKMISNSLTIGVDLVHF